MKAGDLVLLRGTIVSSYGREGQIGLILEKKLFTDRNGYPDAEFSEVLWGDGVAKLYKTNHLEVINKTI